MRPPFDPTEEQRRLVRTLSAMGTRQKEIAKMIGIAPKSGTGQDGRRNDRDEAAADHRRKGGVKSPLAAGRNDTRETVYSCAHQRRAGDELEIKR